VHARVSWRRRQTLVVFGLLVSGETVGRRQQWDTGQKKGGLPFAIFVGPRATSSPDLNGSLRSLTPRRLPGSGPSRRPAAWQTTPRESFWSPRWHGTCGYKNVRANQYSFDPIMYNTSPPGSCQGGGKLSGGPVRPKLSPPKLPGGPVRPKSSDDNFPGRYDFFLSMRKIKAYFGEPFGP